MLRTAVVANDACGIQCPKTERLRRCGQYHCPVDCHMSSWSGYSKCTAECEGGLQTHTRSIMTKPKNGGRPCNTVEETRPCNSQSCDRNCELARWTTWSPCSVACGGGFKEEFRHVLIPTRGAGKCATAKSSFRYTKAPCNEQDCNGDEICIAKQDLIIAIDGSGSVEENGFKTLIDWVGVLLNRYMTEYSGQQAVKVGIVLFGNGVIMPGGQTVSPAINAQKLTFDMKKVKGVVADLPWKKGFTNMAQAFSMAEDMFTKGSRKNAQQSVMVVTDGQPSFSFMTAEMVNQLEDKGIMRYFALVSETPLNDPTMKNMKTWASQPWETNIVHVDGGLLMLEADTELWAEKAVTRFCPKAVSEKAISYGEKLQGFSHVKDGGWCGKTGAVLSKLVVLSKTITSNVACAALASGAGSPTFIMGSQFRRGWCIAGEMDVSQEQYAEWQATKADPQCPGDGWHSSMLYDFYAMEPVAAASLPA